MASDKSYCTPEAYHGETCWLFRNRGNGTFEDVTAKSGIFDTTSKSLGVALLDYDRDGWPDLLVANDTQPNKLYRNLRNGTFEDVAVRAGVAFSEDGKARAGMGVDVADFDNSGVTSIAITNFDNEMMALYRPLRSGVFADIAMRAGIGQPSRNSLGFGCAFFDVNLDGYLDLLAVNGHIDETARHLRTNLAYAQPPNLFVNDGKGGFRDVAAAAGAEFSQPKVARGLALGDYDRDGDVDILITTNQGPAYLYRNDVAAGQRSLRLRLVGTKSNRDAIGAVVRVSTLDGTQSRMVRDGIELPLAIRADAHIRVGTPGRGATRGDRVAQRADAGVQGRARGDVRVRGGRGIGGAGIRDARSVGDMLASEGNTHVTKSSGRHVGDAGEGWRKTLLRHRGRRVESGD